MSVPEQYQPDDCGSTTVHHDSFEDRLRAHISPTTIKHLGASEGDTLRFKRNDRGEMVVEVEPDE